MQRAAKITLGIVLSLVMCVVLAAAIVTWGPYLTPSDAPGIDPGYVSTFGEDTDGPGELTRPIGVAVSPDGRVFVSDAAIHRILAYDSQGKHLFSFGKRGDGPGELDRPMQVNFGPEGMLYVAEYLNDRISVFRADGSFVRHLSPGVFDAPAGVDVADSGEVFVADFYHHNVRVLAADGSLKETWGEPGRIRAGSFHYPTDVEVAPDGSVWVADAYNNRLQRFVDGEAEEIAGWGFFGLKFGFQVADGLGIDPEGRVYGTDFYSGRIRVFDPDGTPMTTFGEPGSGEGQFERPNDIALHDGRAYIVDFGNSRVQVWGL